VCAVTSEWEEPIESAVNDVQNVVNEVEPPLNKAATIVAIGMPWIAEVRSVAMASSYGPTVHGGLTMALAQVPGSGALGLFGSSSGQGAAPTHSVACKDGTQSPTCTWEGGNSTGTTTKSGQPNRGGCCSSHGGILGEGTVTKGEGQENDQGAKGRLGLPVQDDEPDVLCKAAGTILDALIHDTVGKIPLLGGIFDFVGSLMNTLVKAMPEYFCGGGSAADVQGAIGSAIQSAGLDPKTACTQQNIDKHNAQCAKTTCPQSNPSCCVNYANSNACQSDLKSKTTAAENGDANENNSENQSKGNEATKRIVQGSNIGDDNFAVFSVVWSTLGQGADKGVSLPSWGKQTTPAASFLTEISYSKAEFYFDVGIGDFQFKHPGSDEPQEIPDDAMWNMRWRARLRRMHETLPQLGSAVTNAINSSLENLASDIGIPLLADEAEQALTPVEQWISHQGALVDQSLNSEVQQMLGSGSYTVVH
jgi:hypothetical protein